MADAGDPIRRRRVTVHALLVPADLSRRCAVVELPLTAVALSDALGGGLLDDSTRGGDTEDDRNVPELVLESARRCGLLAAQPVS